MKFDWKLFLQVAVAGVSIGSASIGAYVTIKEDIAALKLDVANLHDDVSGATDALKIIARKLDDELFAFRKR